MRSAHLLGVSLVMLTLVSIVIYAEFKRKVAAAVDTGAGAGAG